MNKLIYIDASFTLEDIRARGLDHVLRIRHLEGFWDEVWSAHPVDLRPGTQCALGPYGRPVLERICDGHLFLRGRYGRFAALARLAPLNAVLALVTFTSALARVARREGVDVVRAGDPLMCGLIGLIVARLSGARLMVRINGNHDMIRRTTGQLISPRLFRRAAVEEWVERSVLSRSDLVIAASPNYAEFALGKGARPERVHVVRYGNLIDARHLAPRDARAPIEDRALLQRLAERPWMLHIGRLHGSKHAMDCLEVLEILRDQGSDAGLWLVGDGPLRQAMESRAEASGLTDRVIFLGNVEQEFLARLIPHAAVVLSPLTGRALSEAAFGASAVVAYDLDWQSELVETGKTGILVPARDVAAMAEGAKRLLSDRALARACGEAIRVRALELLSPEEQTRREVELYRSLIGRP